jgi:hypothetical protein
MPAKGIIKKNGSPHSTTAKSGEGRTAIKTDAGFLYICYDSNILKLSQAAATAQEAV